MANLFQKSSFEHWGGIECTINRVGDLYFDQLNFTGHYHRHDDIERIASLGLNRIRYPVLWELHEQDRNQLIDWSWADRQLQSLQSNKISPIVGLVHHGSGPVFTDLLDHSFVTGLSKYARRVAERYPWIDHYTPVNEPLTTARFAGLYGFWYPHKRDNLACFRMLLNQLKAIVFSMREIRSVNPNAKLVQTEDLGKTYSAPVLKYQAAFENERRWLTYDFLCGNVNREHFMWTFLRRVGLSEKEILWFQDNPCDPDICGFNYYLTSERYLDNEIEFYPEHLIGGNGKHRYVDTEAIRIDHQEPFGLKVLLIEAWKRFRRPMAVTELFLSCSQDEQVRWLHDMREQCLNAIDEVPDLDLRAITYWALLGEFGWNNLVTSADGEYESGAYDVRNEIPTETLSADYIRQITRSRSFNKRWLSEKGWWRLEDRFYMKVPCTA